MSTNMDSPIATESRTRSASGPRVDRIVIGLLIGAIGVAWLLDQAGVSVPVADVPGGRPDSDRIGSDSNASRWPRARRAGRPRHHHDRPCGRGRRRRRPLRRARSGTWLVAPAVAEWPVQQHISAGTVTVDLTRHPMPEAGQLQVDVGAGRIVLVLPHESTAGIEATATAGTVTVDGVKVGDGVDLRWSHQSNTSPSVVLTLHVGLGDIEVSHE